MCGIRFGHHHLPQFFQLIQELHFSVRILKRLLIEVFFQSQRKEFSTSDGKNAQGRNW